MKWSPDGPASQRLGVAVFLLVLLAGVLAPTPAEAAEPEWIVQTIEDAADRHGVGRWALVTVARCESRLEPGAIGAAGELGLFQLHHAGLLPAFYRLGYGSPWSVWAQSDFAALMFSQGEATHWSCYWTEVLGRNPPWWRS